jgi:hypothetical protein
MTRTRARTRVFIKSSADALVWDPLPGRETPNLGFDVLRSGTLHE